MLLLVSVIQRASYGGVQVVNSLIIGALDQARIPVTVVSLHDTWAEQWCRDRPGSYCAGGSKGRFLWGAFSRKGYAANSTILVTHIGLAPVGRIIKSISGGRLYQFLHGVEIWGPLTPLQRWALRGTDKLIANSNFTLRHFREVNREFSQKTGEVCYLPARPLPRATAVDQGSGRRTNVLRVLVVGRLWGRGLLKGQRELISIWPRVLEEFPSAELTVVGDGIGRSELEGFAERTRVRDKIAFAGEVSDAGLESIYGSSHVFAMPSRGEGFGLVFAEAMAHGLPCIASRHDAGSEVVVHGETGFTVNPADQDELFLVLKTLLEDEKLRLRMGQRGRERVAMYFSMDAFNQRMLNLLQEKSDVRSES